VLIPIGDFNDYMVEVVDNEAIRDTLQVLNARIATLRATAIEHRAVWMPVGLNWTIYSMPSLHESRSWP